ncbi:hypothetical protein COO60DRAFT_1518692 [Scenedesmus sp. NREL 46B-D3]|nr:hypothetical protein COO60DRAFT_1518692 [Scenedesmus sp. NREL 46B-D3]
MQQATSSCSKLPRRKTCRPPAFNAHALKGLAAAPLQRRAHVATSTSNRHAAHKGHSQGTATAMLQHMNNLGRVLLELLKCDANNHNILLAPAGEATMHYAAVLAAAPHLHCMSRYEQHQPPHAAVTKLTWNTMYSLYRCSMLRLQSAATKCHGCKPPATVEGCSTSTTTAQCCTLCTASNSAEASQSSILHGHQHVAGILRRHQVLAATGTSSGMQMLPVPHAGNQTHSHIAHKQPASIATASTDSSQTMHSHHPALPSNKA